MSVCLFLTQNAAISYILHISLAGDAVAAKNDTLAMKITSRNDRARHCVSVASLAQHHAEPDFMQPEALIHSPLLKPELNKLCISLLTNKVT
jgi:hypothetical protein